MYMRPLININKRAYLTVRDDWYVWLGLDHLFLCEAQIFRVIVLFLIAFIVVYCTLSELTQAAPGFNISVYHSWVSHRAWKEPGGWLNTY